MNRRDAGVRPSGFACLRRWAWAVVLFGPVGCTEPLTRPQSDEEPERDRYEVRTIGEVTQLGNAEPVYLGGIGLVVGLEGGGESTPEDRSQLENELRKLGVKNGKEWINRPDAAIVRVSS